MLTSRADTGIAVPGDSINTKISTTQPILQQLCNVGGAFDVLPREVREPRRSSSPGEIGLFPGLGQRKSVLASVNSIQSTVQRHNPAQIMQSFNQCLNIVILQRVPFHQIGIVQ